MNPEIYSIVKTIHISCALISICGFCFRAALKLGHSTLLKPRWLRILPHLNDSLLLGCAIYLTASINQSPVSNSWLTAKVIALLAYIGSGMLVMRFAKSQRQRLIALVLALISFAYIVAVAVSHDPYIGLIS